MTGSDHVFLFDDPGFQIRTHVLPWPHPWPPWDRLYFVVGRTSDEKALVHDKGMAELVDHCRAIGTTVDDNFTVTGYTLEAHSDLPDDVATNTDSHVFRAARYLRDQR